MPELKSPRREEVLRLKEEGLSNARIGFALGISRQRVGQIVNYGRGKKSVSFVPESLLSTAQVALVLNVHINTVRRWSNTNMLPSYRIGTRGDRRFRWVDIERLLRRRFIRDIPAVMGRLSELEAETAEKQPVATQSVV
jgi:excisionase family DNA binding protein